MTDNVVDAMKNAQARGCDIYITSHYRGPKRTQEGKVIIPDDLAKLGFYMPSEGNIEKIARVCRTMIQVLMSAEDFPGPAFKCDRGHPYEWYKNHLNVFQRVGPGSLAEYLRKAGRVVPRIVGTEWMEAFVQDSSLMIQEGSSESEVDEWLLASSVLDPRHRIWIYQEAFTRNWLRS